MRCLFVGRSNFPECFGFFFFTLLKSTPEIFIQNEKLRCSGFVFFFNYFFYTLVFIVRPLLFGLFVCSRVWPIRFMRGETFLVRLDSIPA